MAVIFMVVPLWLHPSGINASAEDDGVRRTMEPGARGDQFTGLAN